MWLLIIFGITDKSWLYLKSGQKVWNILESILYSGVILKWDVLCTIAERVIPTLQCYLFCNNGQFESWGIASMRWWGREVMCQIWALQTNPQLYWLNFSSGMPLAEWWCFFQSGLCCCSADLAHLLRDPTTSERQYLSSDTGYGYKWGSIVKQKEYALQWYTIQYTSFPNNSRNGWFPKYFEHFVLTLVTLSSLCHQKLSPIVKLSTYTLIISFNSILTIKTSFTHVSVTTLHDYGDCCLIPWINARA